MLDNLITNKTIYISYAGGKSDNLKDTIKTLLKEKLIGGNYTIIDYKDLNDSGQQYNIDDLIIRIGIGLFVVVIIDKKYLTGSIYTIKEICRLTQRGGLPDRVYPIYSDDSLILYKMDISNKDALLKEAKKTIKLNIPEQGISPAHDIEVDDLKGCNSHVANFLKFLDANVNWAYKSNQHAELVQSISQNIEDLNKPKQPSMLRPISKKDLKSNASQGGSVHTEKNFIYTVENSNLFFERDIVKKILIQLKPKTSKSIHVIHGKNGSGKTTMLRQITESLLERDNNRIYFSDNGATSHFADGLDYLDNDEETNRIVIIDKLKFKNIDALYKILDMVKNENKFHLLLTISDTYYGEDNPIKKYIEYTKFNNTKEYISDDYSSDWGTILNIYEKNFPEVKNKKMLGQLSRGSKPLIYLSSIIYNDDNLDDSIKNLLKVKKKILDDYGYELINVLSTIYFYTSKGEVLWINDIASSKSNEKEIILLLEREGLLSLDTHTLKGVSSVYDMQVLSVILEQDFEGSYDKFFSAILDTYFKFFEKLSPLFAYKKNIGFNKEEEYRLELELFKNLDTVLDLISIHDLFDFKNIIVNSQNIDNQRRKIFLEKLIQKFYLLNIEDMKAFKRYKYFYLDIKNIYIEKGWKYDFETLDFDTTKYYYSRYGERYREYNDYIDLNKLMMDYDKNYNLVVFVVADLFFEPKHAKSHVEIERINDNTKEKINILLKKLYGKINDLSPIEIAFFLNLLGYKCLYADSFDIDSGFDLSRIYTVILQKYKFSSYSFVFISEMLYYLSSQLIKKSFFNIDGIIKDKLKGDYVIFDFLISKRLLKNEDIPKLISYFVRYYRGNNPILTYKLFQLYKQDTKEYFKSEDTEDLVRWAVNVAYKDVSQRSKQGLLKIQEDSWLGIAMHTEYRANILEYLGDNRLYSTAQKYINIFATSDWARNKKEENKINYQKYYNIIIMATKDFYTMLYAENKTYINIKNLEKYALYCAKQKSRGISLLYIKNEDEYKKYRNRAMIIFDILANFYLENKGREYPANIVANILKTIDTPNHKLKDEIVRLFMVDINNRKSEQHEKSIMDLTNYYKDIGHFYDAEKIITVAIEHGLINRCDNINHLPTLLKEIKCDSRTISLLLNSYSSVYEIGKTYEGVVSNITRKLIFVRMPKGLNGILYKNEMTDSDFKRYFHSGERITVKIKKNQNGRIELLLGNK